MPTERLANGQETPRMLDWNLAALGNPRIELADCLPSLSVEGGQPPDQLTGPDDAPLAVTTAGHFAARAGRPPSSPPHERYLAAHATQAILPWAFAG